MHPCPAWRCRDVDGNPVIIADADAMCEFHIAKVSKAITELPDLYAQLTDALVPGRAGDDMKVTSSRTPPIPMNVAARSLQEDMLAVTRLAEHRYRLRQGWVSVGRRGRELPTLTGRCRFITAHLAGILAETVDVGLRVLDIKHQARNLLGVTKLVHRLPAPCPECDSMALQREDGASWVRCRHCGLTFGEDAYGVLVRVLVEANRAKP